MMEKSNTRKAYERDESLIRYFGEISDIPLLSSQEEIEIAKKIRKGNRRALTKLIQSNLRFVVRVALDYKNQGLPLADLINEGNLGLIKAAKRFDETKGFKFISYAVWWIKQSILQALAEHSRVVRLPLNRVSVLSRVGKTHDNLEQVFEREPTVDEIAECLEISSGEVKMVYQIHGRQLSLDAPISDKEGNTLLEITEDAELIPPDEPITNGSLKEEIEKAFKSISNKEAEVLRMYFGMDMDRPATLEEIGAKFRLTRERVRQIKEKAIIRLRHQSRSKALKQYLG
ncbi:MAG: sigma-70 family RNA polymerase sigma factor [Calditrichia bacterium]|nr:sigma-70 family RNA polymerase sigma factor [Calditrichia bacterium]